MSTVALLVCFILCAATQTYSTPRLCVNVFCMQFNAFFSIDMQIYHTAKLLLMLLN